MQTIKLRVSDTVYKNLMWFLSKFSKDELQIIDDNNYFSSTKEELQTELESAKSGKAEFLDIDQLDKHLEAVIQKHES